MQNKKPKIAIVMIGKDEEELVARCLESVKEADYIFFSDTGSSDKTVEIVKKYTDRIWTEDKWHDSFCDARNFILNKVKEELKDENVWCASIDCDEYLVDFSKVLSSVKLAESKGMLALDVKLVSEKEKQVHFFPRLFKMSDKVWWEGAAHNHISVRAEGTSEVEIIYGYSPAHQKNPDRTLNILKKEVALHHNARETFYLGREYWYRAMYRECAEIMEDYVKIAHFMPEKADAYLIMARCYFFMGMGDKAREACANAIIINPQFREAVKFMARLAGRGSGNPVWEKNGEWWEKASENSNNTMVLFIRDEK